jgi:hypothetical protein
MRWTHGLLMLVLVSSVSLGAGAGAQARARAVDERSDDRVLERLEADERARDAERAAAEAKEREEILAREREREEVQRRKAAAELAAARAHARRAQAMAAWHAQFAETLEPVLRARRALYRRMPSRRFARVRPQCEEVAAAVEVAFVAYAPAPERRVDVLARELLAVYRESGRYCTSGSYFSFTVQERRVRWLAAELIAELEPFGLAFPPAASDLD